MVPKDQPQRRDMLDYMLRGINNQMLIPEGKLTEWETEFITSVIDQFQSKGDLSDKQAAIVEKIFDKLSIS